MTHDPDKPVPIWGRRRSWLLAPMLGLSKAALASARPAERAPASQPAATKRVADGMVLLGDRIMRDVGAGGPPVQVFSPYNLYCTLGMLGLGARGAASAAFRAALGLQEGGQALAAALRLARTMPGTGGAARTTTAYSAWSTAARGFQPGWRELARTALAPRLGQLDFASPAAAASINDWARDATRGEIPAVVDQLPAGTELVLAGAIHFVGQWATPFDPARTESAAFRRRDGSSAMVPMMRLEDTVAYGGRDGAHVVRLPYGGGRMALWVATAVEPQGSGAVLDRIIAQGTAAWLAGVPMQQARCAVRLPKLSLSAGGDMLATLRRAGFGAALGGDLSGITGLPVQVSQIAHQARIRIDEVGTVAAAATAIGVTRSMEQLQEFSADRPFLFMLGLVDPAMPLFAGVVNDPPVGGV